MNYGRLDGVLARASEQASKGKGAERHSDGQAFEEQPIMWIEREFKSFQLGQAVKKIHESQRLEPGAAVRELLGAINYLAAKVMALEAVPEKENERVLKRLSLPSGPRREENPGEAGPSMNKPCVDCHQQFGDYCLLACPFGKRKSDAD